MFYIGLEFNYKGIKEPRRLFAGCTDFVVNFSVGFLLGHVIGLNMLEAFILASAVYISSSAIVISSLIENKRLIYPGSRDCRVADGLRGHNTGDPACVAGRPLWPAASP